MQCREGGALKSSWMHQQQQQLRKDQLIYRSVVHQLFDSCQLVTGWAGENDFIFLC